MIRSALREGVTLDRIRDVLAEDRTGEALHLTDQHDERSDAWQNARGVCLLRLGLYERAVQVLRGIVFPGDRICFADDIPALYRSNYATAMLLTHNIEAALAILEHLNLDGHPHVRQLQKAASRWRESLTLLQEATLALGWYPTTPVRLDFPPGGI